MAKAYLPATASTKARRFAGVGLWIRTRCSGRTAASAASCVTACGPVPISAARVAPSGARARVATPLMAAVRSMPSARASITARSRPVSASNRLNSDPPPALVWTQVLKPA